MSKPTASPLQWPPGWPRKLASERRRAPYRMTMGHAHAHLLAELRRGGARDVVLSTNLPLRRDGLPYLDVRDPADPGACLYWTDRAGNERVMPCDRWTLLRDNIHAIGMCYESIRRMERTGASEIVARVMEGFRLLPEGRREVPWWEVLELPSNATRAQIETRYIELARKHHPDHGGTAERMAQINVAYAEAKR